MGCVCHAIHRASLPSSLLFTMPACCCCSSSCSCCMQVRQGQGSAEGGCGRPVRGVHEPHCRLLPHHPAHAAPLCHLCGADAGRGHCQVGGGCGWVGGCGVGGVWVGGVGGWDAVCSGGRGSGAGRGAKRGDAAAARNQQRSCPRPPPSCPPPCHAGPSTCSCCRGTWLRGVSPSRCARWGLAWWTPPSSCTVQS